MLVALLLSPPDCQLATRRPHVDVSTGIKKQFGDVSVPKITSFHESAGPALSLHEHVGASDSIQTAAARASRRETRGLQSEGDSRACRLSQMLLSEARRPQCDP